MATGISTNLSTIKIEQKWLKKIICLLKGILNIECSISRGVGISKKDAQRQFLINQYRKDVRKSMKNWYLVKKDFW